MKVNRSPVSRTKESSRSKAKAKASTVQPAQFKTSLEDSIKKQLREKLNALLKEIDSEGENILKKRTLDVLLKYKKLVKNFLDTVVKNTYLLKENVNFNPRGKQNILILVENIDQSLEELATMVLNKEVDNLNLLEKIGEIRGMLIDIYS